MNTICHVEIPVTDLDKAQAFYHKVFGYTIGNPFPKYGLISNDVSIGMPVVETIDSPDSRVYIQVSDIEKTLQLINSSGGKTVSEKNKISDEIGFGAKFSDPFGNIIGLFAPE